MKKGLILLSVLLAMGFSMNTLFADESPKINVLLFTGGEIHNYQEIGDALEAGLKSYGRFNLTRVANDLSYFTKADLSKFDVILFEYTVGTITEGQKRAIMNFVAGGKGFVGIHSTTDSFRGDPDWRAFMGAHFIGHPPYRDFQVSVTQPDHPIMQGFPVEFMARDEMYIMDYDPRLNILCASYYKGKVVPVAYTKNWGDGRMYYHSFGHDGAGAGRAYALRMIGRALLWAANQENLDMPANAVGYIGRDGFISSWNILGPIPESELEWEKNRFGRTVPDFEKTVMFEQSKFEWIQARTESPNGDIDLTQLLTNGEQIVAYAYATFSIEKAMQGKLKIGSNDGVVCWLNGKLVHSNLVQRGLAMDSDVVPVEFKSGENRIMLKITQWGGSWGFSCRVADESGDPLDLTKSAVSVKK